MDVRIRIAWLLRMARLTAAAGEFHRQADMIEPLRDVGVATTPTALSRLESGYHRLGRVVDGYERVLGLPTGRLRAPIDITCRAFADSPVDRDPGVEPNTVSSLSAAIEPVLDGRATGGEWLRWAQALAQPDAKGLPRHLVLELFARLVSELGRSVGAAYPVRYQALALLRCSAYGDLVRTVVDVALTDPDCQVAEEMMRAVAERADQATWLWAIRHLADPRVPVVRGAVAAMVRMIGQHDFDRDWWFDALEPLHDVLSAMSEAHEHRDCLGRLTRLLPSDLRRGLAHHVRVVETVGETPGPLSGAGPDLGHQWAQCVVIAAAVSREVGIEEQSVLTRLIFDVLMGTRERRARLSLMLLEAVPFAGTVVEVLADAAAAHEEPTVRQRAHRRLRQMRGGAFPKTLPRWFTGSRSRQLTALVLAGQSGHPLPRDVLTELLPAGACYTRGALLAAGFAADPALKDLAADATQSPEVRGAARWWLDQGARVTDGAV